MNKRIIPLLLVFSILMTIIMPFEVIAGEIGRPETGVNTKEELEKESTIYAGEIFVNGSSQLKYIYSDNITITQMVFENLKSALTGTNFEDLVPNVVNDTTAVSGFFKYSGTSDNEIVYQGDTNYFGGIDVNWSSAATVAQMYFNGNIGQETNSNLYDVNETYKNNIDTLYSAHQLDVTEPLDFNKRILSVISSSVKSDWVMDNGSLKRIDTITFGIEATTVVYTSVNITTDTEILKGDLDGNNVVDANDASVALELYKAQNATAEDIAIGDMDNNNLIDANDASLILEYYKTNQ